MRYLYYALGEGAIGFANFGLDRVRVDGVMAQRLRRRWRARLLGRSIANWRRWRLQEGEDGGRGARISQRSWIFEDGGGGFVSTCMTRRQPRFRRHRYAG
jgi:hypothetical protein